MSLSLSLSLSLSWPLTLGPQHHATVCQATPHHNTPGHTMLSSVTQPCYYVALSLSLSHTHLYCYDQWSQDLNATPHHAMPQHTTLHYAKLCHPILLLCLILSLFLSFISLLLSFSLSWFPFVVEYLRSFFDHFKILYYHHNRNYNPFCQLTTGNKNQSILIWPHSQHVCCNAFWKGKLEYFHKI